MTPGRTHNISNNKLAAVNAVIPATSYGGDTFQNKRMKKKKREKMHIRGTLLVEFLLLGRLSYKGGSTL